MEDGDHDASAGGDCHVVTGPGFWMIGEHGAEGEHGEARNKN